MLSPDDLYEINDETAKLVDKLHNLKVAKYKPCSVLSALGNYLVLCAIGSDHTKEQTLRMMEDIWNFHSKD